jgi:hypothetical protein
VSLIQAVRAILLVLVAFCILFVTSTLKSLTTHVRTEANANDRTRVTVEENSIERMSITRNVHLFDGANSTVDTKADVSSPPSLPRDRPPPPPSPSSFSSSSPDSKAAVVDTDPCVEAKAAADAIYVASTVAAQSKLSWPVIMNASLFVVDRNYIDGWVVKGTDIVSSAIFAGRPESHSIHLIDAHGSTVPCTAQMRTSRGTYFCCMIPD